MCPTGASYKRDDGVVLVDHSKCIGCQYCVMACPYGVRVRHQQGQGRYRKVHDVRASHR
ncbi:MAG: 4Fe-4S dicluster domain-containing protein [Eggerthella lenta]